MAVRAYPVLMIFGGIAGILTLIPPFQIPLAFAVGWMGLWLVRSAGREDQPAPSWVDVTA